MKHSLGLINTVERFSRFFCCALSSMGILPLGPGERKDENYEAKITQLEN